MIYGLTKTKPRLAGRGFAQSTCGLFAFFIYPIGTAGANAYIPFPPVAIRGAERGAALLWGAVS